MRQWVSDVAVALTAVVLGGLSSTCASAELTPRDAGSRLALVQRIPLPGVAGRMDHLGIDLAGHRLFAAALGNDQNTVEVVDFEAGRRIFSIHGQSKPQGVFYSEEFKKLFVSNGNDGTYKVFDGEDLKLISSVPIGLNPNHVGYDPVSKNLYIGFRDERSGRLAIVDTSTGKHIGDIRTDALPGGIKIESNGPRIFVTLLGQTKLGVIDRDKRQQVATWPIPRPVAALALDEERHRLFAGGRNPPKLSVFDTASGRQIAELDCVSGIDDLWYDGARHRIYATGTDGIAVYDQQDGDHYAPMAKVMSSPGAATSIWVPTLNRLFVSAPKTGNGDAAILVFEARH